VHGWLLAERPDLMRLQGMAAAARRELATIAGGKSV
jgi:hypothetical protein